MCLLATGISSSEKYLLKFFAIYKMELYFYCQIVNIFYIFWILDSYLIHAC